MLHGYLLKEYIQPPAQASSRFHALASPKPFPRDFLAVVTGPSGDLVPAGGAGRLLCSRVLPSEVAGPALWCGDRHALPVPCHGSQWPVGPCWGTGAALQPTHVSTTGPGWGCPRGTPAGAVPRVPGAVCHPRSPWLVLPSSLVPPSPLSLYFLPLHLPRFPAQLSLLRPQRPVLSSSWPFSFLFFIFRAAPVACGNS